MVPAPPIQNRHLFRFGAGIQEEAFQLDLGRAPAISSGPLANRGRLAQFALELLDPIQVTLAVVETILHHRGGGMTMLSRYFECRVFNHDRPLSMLQRHDRMGARVDDIAVAA
jgi:hypothetical protein